MKVTTKGQVTIPKEVRAKLGIEPHSEVDFVEERGRVYLVKKNSNSKGEKRFGRFRGAASAGMSTEEIMQLTRGGS